MSSPSIYELGRLLNELRRVSSPLQRMKLLARGWRSIQRLTPGERRELAKHVGVEGAENLIERMAIQKGRVGPALIQRALDKIRESDPEQLGRLLTALRDSGQRSVLIKKGVEKIADRMQAPEQAAPEPEPEPEPQPEQTPAAIPEPEPEPEPEFSAEPQPEPEPEPAPEPPPEPEPEAQPRVEIATEPAPPQCANPLLESIEQTDSLTLRFRALREEIGHARALGSDQLERLLSYFPHEWARRRVLMALFSAGLPSDDGQAIDLIGNLVSPVSRRWCAHVLRGQRELGASDGERLQGLC